MKKIPNFSKYKITDTGIIYSINYRNTGCERIMKTKISTTGYYRVNLTNDDNKIKTVNIHKLVMLTYIGDRPKDLVINHIDGNKLNNNLNNLEYCSQKENIIHAINNGLFSPKINQKGEKNCSSKLKEQDVIEIRKILNNDNLLFIASKYSVSKWTILDIRNKRTWKHI